MKFILKGDHSASNNISVARILILLSYTLGIIMFSCVATYYYMENSYLKEQLARTEEGPAITQGIQVCLDSDGGQDHYLNGAIKYRRYSSNGSVAATGDSGDDCVDQPINGKSTIVLREYYCDANNSVNYEYFNCPKGCLNGVCKK